MSIPSYKANGTISGNTVGGYSIFWPNGHATNDVALLFVETANSVVSFINSGGFSAVSNSPQGVGPLSGTTSTRLSAYWARASSAASQSRVEFATPNDHWIAKIFTYGGCVTTGLPFDMCVGNTQSTSTVSVSISGTSTTLPDCLVVVAATSPTDYLGNNSEWGSTLTNSNLSNLIVRYRKLYNVGGSNSAQIIVGDGGLATAGTVGTTTAWMTVASTMAGMSIALRSTSTTSVPTVPPDPPSSTSQNPVHRYSSSTTYTVTLTVTDSSGYTSSVSHDVHV